MARAIRKSLIGFVAALVLIAALSSYMPRAAWHGPFRMLRLQTQPPDTVLLMPVRGATVKSVADTWQAPRPDRRKHQGQDIFARRGTPVVSATEGIVLRVGENKLGGKTVSVLGRGGRMYYYAHLDGYAEGLQPGYEVSAGSLLGYVGNTGNARTTPPHLHFGVYSATGVVDPLPLLVDRKVDSEQPSTGPKRRA